VKKRQRLPNPKAGGGLQSPSPLSCITSAFAGVIRIGGGSMSRFTRTGKSLLQNCDGREQIGTVGSGMP